MDGLDGYMDIHAFCHSYFALSTMMARKAKRMDTTRRQRGFMGEGEANCIRADVDVSRET